MALRIVELFGYGPQDDSPAASDSRAALRCPFLGQRCVKVFRDGLVSGACTLRQANTPPVICCPVRLYANNYETLLDSAVLAFGEGVRLIQPTSARDCAHDGRNVVVFGQRWGKELRLPARGGRGSYSVDWVLARIGTNGRLAEFGAVEVQAIDTTGNYRDERAAYMRGEQFQGFSRGSLNWENVSKRILPQIIYKGHVLRLEPLCQKGLFFICPTALADRIRERLGGNLREYAPHPGAVTFVSYGIAEAPFGAIRPLVRERVFTSTIDQVALAFTSPQNLPEAGVYERAIRHELGEE